MERSKSTGTYFPRMMRSLASWLSARKKICQNGQTGLLYLIAQRFFFFCVRIYAENMAPQTQWPNQPGTDFDQAAGYKTPLFMTHIHL